MGETFEVGDKVFLIDTKDESPIHLEKYKKYLGKIFTIKRISQDKGGNYAEFKENDDIVPYLKNLKKVEDIKNFMVIGDNLESKIIYRNDNLIVNEEKGDDNMKILDIYKNRMTQKINEEYDKKIEEINEKDEIQQIVKEMEEQINIILENEGRTSVDICCTKRTTKTLDAEENLFEEKTNQLRKLNNDIDEIKAMLELTNDYEEQIKILKNYGIIDKKTNKLVEEIK